MTREEAIAFFKDMNECTYGNLEAVDMAIKALEVVGEFEKARILTGGRLNGRAYAYKCGLKDGERKALEQEPFINKPCISSVVCEHDKNKVLDKIRAEIDNALSDGMIHKKTVLGIIDKYKIESEKE